MNDYKNQVVKIIPLVCILIQYLLFRLRVEIKPVEKVIIYNMIEVEVNTRENKTRHDI